MNLILKYIEVLEKHNGRGIPAIGTIFIEKLPQLLFPEKPIPQIFHVQADCSQYNPKQTEQKNNDIIPNDGQSESIKSVPSKIKGRSNPTLNPDH